MDTEYGDEEIQRLCNNHKHSIRKIGPMMTLKLEQRISEINASDNLSILKTISGARCHDLTGNRNGQWAVDLKHPKRLIFLPYWSDENKSAELVKKIRLLEIVDYH